MAENESRFDVKTRSRGFTGYCGLEFTEVTEDHCVVSCPMRPELLNPGGIAHGGLIATLTDVAAGSMALMADGRAHSIVTQSCNIQYLRPGPGECLRAESRVVRKGNRVCVVQVDCFSGDGSLAAVATYEIAYLGN